MKRWDAGNATKQLSMDARRMIVAEKIAAGKTFGEIITECAPMFGITNRTMTLYLRDALAWLRSDEMKETIQSMNVMRLDKLYSDSVSEGDRKSAIKALDVQNKMVGAYEEKLKVEGDSDIDLTVKFK